MTQLTELEVFELILSGDADRVEFINCDEMDCEYIEYYLEIGDFLVDKKCPKCDSILLTRKDYDAFKANRGTEL